MTIELPGGACRVIHENDRRFFTTRDDARCAFRAAGRGGSIGTLRGYPIVWNVLSEDRGGYKVRLLPGSATFSGNVIAQFHDDEAALLGTTDSATLRALPADSYGQPVEIDLPETLAGRDALELVRIRLVRGMSFIMGGDVQPRAMETIEGGERVINFDRFGVAYIMVTPVPAFGGTSVALATPERAGAFAERTRQALQLERLRFRTISLDDPD